ncbi:unnamed protein product [Lactuca saligna]|uniref:Uncharacterized protein n=1 Tax=Lactuca saligna TaxID=75948 RepID=A0AA35VA69_LACSI|nr:unnamed protein product [Lactuca saligna]
MQINMNFQRVFEKFDDLKLDALLASEVGPSHAKGGNAKLKTKLTVDVFRATQPMLPPIHAQRFFPIDECYPIKKTDELSNEPMIPPPSEVSSLLLVNKSSLPPPL